MNSFLRNCQNKQSKKKMFFLRSLEFCYSCFVPYPSEQGESVSKYVTNRSKTAVMDVIGFLYVSLDSSTVQLHNTLGSRAGWAQPRPFLYLQLFFTIKSLGSNSARACSEAGFSSQNGDRVCGVYYRRAAFCCAVSCGQNGSMKRIFINKCFLFTVGSVSSLKRFITGSRNSLKDVRKLRLMPDRWRK
jgi:hypothetical protein